MKLSLLSSLYRRGLRVAINIGNALSTNLTDESTNLLTDESGNTLTSSGA